MASTAGTYRVRKLSHRVTLSVRIVETPELRLRVWIAKRLIWLAARVLGCRNKIEREDAS